MNTQDILTAIGRLAHTQGFYSRLYEKLTDGSEESEDYLIMLETQKFSDVVDLVMFLES